MSSFIDWVAHYCILQVFFGADIREWSFNQSIRALGRCSSDVANPNSKCFTTQKWDFESDFLGTFDKMLADHHQWTDLPNEAGIRKGLYFFRVHRSQHPSLNSTNFLAWDGKTIYILQITILKNILRVVKNLVTVGEIIWREPCWPLSSIVRCLKGRAARLNELA